MNLTIEEAKNIRELSLTNLNLREKGIEALSSILPLFEQLQHLSLGGNHMGDRGAQFMANVLSRLKNLKIIYLNFNQIGPEGMKWLALAFNKMKSIEKIYLFLNPITSRGLQFFPLFLNPNIKKLWLANTELRSEDAKVIVRSFLLVPRLEDLVLKGNQLGDWAAFEIADNLSLLPHLKRLDLTFNHITQIGRKALMQSASKEIVLSI